MIRAIGVETARLSNIQFAMHPRTNGMSEVIISVNRGYIAQLCLSPPATVSDTPNRAKLAKWLHRSMSSKTTFTARPRRALNPRLTHK